MLRTCKGRYPPDLVSKNRGPLLFAPAPANRSVSSAAPFRKQILAWHGQGITAKAIHWALVRKVRFTGSVHTIYRLLDRIVDLPVAARQSLRSCRPYQ